MKTLLVAASALWAVTAFGLEANRPDGRQGRFFHNAFWEGFHRGLQRPLQTFQRVAENGERPLIQDRSDVMEKMDKMATMLEERVDVSMPMFLKANRRKTTLREDPDDKDEDFSISTRTGGNRVRTKQTPVGQFNPFSVFMPNPGFNFFNMAHRSQWWKGPNVCVDREEIDEGLPDKSPGVSTNSNLGSSVSHGFSFGLGSLEFTTCKEFDEKYVCTETTNRRGIGKTVRIVYRCCHGFSRDLNGCFKVELRPLASALENLGATDFVSLAVRTNGLDLLNRENLTVFVPTNEAFQEFTADIEENNDIFSAPDSKVQGYQERRRIGSTDLASVFMSHLVPGFFFAGDMRDEQILQSINQNSTIRINSYETSIPVATANCARIIKVNQHASNGVIHTVDRVIRPATLTLAEIIRTDPQFSTFNQLLGKSGLHKLLSSPGQLTAFVPSNTAFKRLDPAVLDSLHKGNGCLEAIIRNHLLPNAICSSAIESRGKSINLLDVFLILRRTEDDRIMANDIEVVGRDIIGTNGIIHVLDHPLIPSEAQPIMEILKLRNLTTFIELLQAADMTKEVSNLKGVTIFAPNNAAFERMSVDELTSLRANRDHLKKFLKYHITSSLMKPQDIQNNHEMETQSGETIRINLYSNSPLLFDLFRPENKPIRMTIGCSRVSSMETRACGSIIHIMEDVLRPPKKTILEELESDPEYSIFRKMVEETNSSRLLSSNIGPLTLLAPSDHVFRTLPEEELKIILSDRIIKEELIGRHILKEQVCCSGINPSTFLSMDHKRALDNSVVHVRRTYSGRLMAGSARIVRCGDPTLNGVVHRVNALLVDVRPQRRPYESQENRRRVNPFSSPNLDFFFGF